MTVTPRQQWRVGLAAAITAVTLAGCSNDPERADVDGAPEASATPTTSASGGSPSAEADSPSTVKRPPRIRHVVVVSLDGTGTNVLEAVGLDRLPTLRGLLTNGAATLNARSEVERTVTLPNHAGMLTGRPVDPAIGGHGVTLNGRTTSTVQQLAGEEVESVFDVVHDTGGSTALFATEDKFALFDQSWPDSIDRFTSLQDADEDVMAEAVADLLSEQRALTFIHLGVVDEIGHRNGWESVEQQVAAVQADTLLSDLVEAIASDRRLARTTALIVTADHGGVGRLHDDATDPRDFTVPFVVQGPGIDRGADLYELNPDLSDPGDAQPAYDADRGPVRNGFVANLVTQLLRLPSVEGSVFDLDGLALSGPPR